MEIVLDEMEICVIVRNEKRSNMWQRYGVAFDWEENDDVWEAIVNYMDDDIREQVHMELAPCTNRQFIERYLELDPEFEQLLAEEFSIEWV